MRSLATAFLVSALAVAGSACSKKAAAGKDAPPEPTIDPPLSAVVEAPTPTELTLTGTVSPDESSDVASDIPGKVVAVMVERGASIKQGDPLVRLDTRNAQLGAREAKANLAAAKAQRQLAEDECARAQALYDKGAITKSQFEREQTSCTAALQQVAAAEARTDMITKSISDGIVRAPFTGVVSDRWISPGEWVSPGTKLVTLVDADPLKVELTIPEAGVPDVKVGQDVVVKAVAWDKPFHATISRMGAQIGRDTRALVAEATLDPGTPLVPGMFVEAVITIANDDLHAVIPETAAVKRNQTHRVFVAFDGRLQERVVQLGPVPAPGMYSVLKGLTPGEHVVTVADDKSISDGMKLTGKAAAASTVKPPADAPADKPADAPADKPAPAPSAAPVEKPGAAGSAAPAPK
jgi:membrane fusion protein (multidrug efflux system)